MLQLGNNQAKDFVACLLQLLDHFTLRILRLVVLEQVLNVRFDVSLLETIPVLLPLYVLSIHVVTHALLLPVEFEVNVAGDCGDGECAIGQFHNFAQHVFIGDT